MSDHYHYGYADEHHSHGDYSDRYHDHDYAETHHRHHDDERVAAWLREDLGHAEERIRELEDGLRDALGRIRQLEQQTPQARQLQYEADLAAGLALAESGYERRDEEEQTDE